MVNIGESITIVTACRNRLDNLNKVINSWANIKPKKIIIIDYGSDKKIVSDKLDLREKVNIEIIREESDRWILSWAFNLGLEKVNTKYTLKLDCESFLKDNFLIKNKPKRMSFIRGNWRFYEQDQIFFNGSFLSCTQLLKEVGYYDERFTTYGWEDSELYERLSDNALEANVIDPDSFDVIPQEISKRTIYQDVELEKLLSDQLSIPIEKFLIRRNRKYSYLIEKWSKEKYLRRLEIRSKNSLQNNPKLLYATFQTFFQLSKSNKSFETEFMREKFTIRRFNLILKNYYSEYKNLFPNFPILRKYLRELKNNPLNDLYKTQILYSAFINLYKIIDMNILSNILKKDSSTTQFAVNDEKSLLIVVPQMGLCNRIRSIASAYCIAKNSNRKLIICWDKDYHLNCEMDDLFSIDDDQIELQNTKLLSKMHDFRIYDYSEFIPNNHKFKKVEVNTPLPILIKSSSSIFSEFTSFEEEDLFIKSLKINGNVQKIINQNKIAENTVGVHIRYSGENWENELSESKFNWSEEDHNTIVIARNQSKPENFIRKMELLLEKDNNLKFYISSPNNLSEEFFKERLGECIHSINIPKSGNEREKTQLEYALADLVNLSKCKLILGSPYSSFSRMAYRLNNFKDKKIEIVGEDF